MANLREENKWEAGIYQLETTDPVVGGVDGISNKQAIQLANRTSYLKGEIEALKSDPSAKLKEDNRFIKNQMVDGYVIANHFHMKMKTQDEFVDGNIDICFRASQPVITDNPTPFRFMSLNKLKEAVKPQLAASFSQSGYVTLDNGLIVQWGKVTGEGEKNFPIAFPRACFTVVAGNADAQGDTADNAFAYPISKEKFYYATKVTNVYKVIAGYPGSFIAIGW